MPQVPKDIENPVSSSSTARRHTSGEVLDERTAKYDNRYCNLLSGDGKRVDLFICRFIVIFIICLASSLPFQAAVFPKLVSKQNSVYSSSRKHSQAACNRLLKNNKEIVLNAKSNDVTVIEGTYGRLGNRIRAMRLAINSALDQGCHIRLPQVLDGEEPEWCYVQNLKLRDHHWCAQTSAENWFFERDTIPPDEYVRRHDESLVNNIGENDEMAKCVEYVVQQYFSVNETHAFNKPCPKYEIFAMHVRSGDVTSGQFDTETGIYQPHGVHGSYGLFPTAYYVAAMKYALEGGYAKVLVFCEDDGNPTCDFFVKLQELESSLEVRMSTPLLEDLYYLNCAAQVAVSFGTFFQAYSIIQRPKVFHVFSETMLRSNENKTATCQKLMPIYCNGCRDLKLYYLSDVDESVKYTSHVRQHWRNTAYQRYLVNKAYIVESISCST